MQEAYLKEKLLNNEKLKKYQIENSNLEKQLASTKDRNNKLILSQSMGPNQMNGLLNDLRFQHEDEVQEWKDRIADMEFVVEEAKERERQ